MCILPIDHREEKYGRYLEALRRDSVLLEDFVEPWKAQKSRKARQSSSVYSDDKQQHNRRAQSNAESSMQTFFQKEKTMPILNIVDVSILAEQNVFTWVESLQLCCICQITR